MAILVQTINDRMLSLLDSEDSDRYLFNQDIMPAINGAMEILVTMFNEAFAANKLTPECLRELSKVKIWQCNQYSRFSIDPADIGGEIWTITSIYPLPVTNQGASSATPTDKSESQFRGDLSFVSSNYSCKRLTLEEWNTNALNIFTPGNDLLKGGLQDYAYLDPNDYTSTSYTGNPAQIEYTIRPAIPNGLVAVGYVKYPKQVALISDSIEFPQLLTDLIVDLSLSKISFKQGDQTSLYGVTSQYINRLVSLIKTK
jgi:hypothetical protein